MVFVATENPCIVVSTMKFFPCWFMGLGNGWIPNGSMCLDYSFIGPLCGESNGHWWIPHMKGWKRRPLVHYAVSQKKLSNNSWISGDLRYINADEMSYTGGSLRKTDYMKTSSYGNIFRIAGHLFREFTDPRWIPRTKASDAELCLNKRFSKQSWGWWFETQSCPFMTSQ